MLYRIVAVALPSLHAPGPGTWDPGSGAERVEVESEGERVGGLA